MKVSGARSAAEAKQASEFDNSHDLNEVELLPERGGFGGWKLTFLAFALGGVAIMGVAMIGGLFTLKGGEPGLRKAPPVIATPPAAATVNTPTVATLIAAPPPTASQFPDPKTVRSVSLRPNGTPIAPPPPSATDSGEAAQASGAAKPPAKPAPKAASEIGGIAQPATPKLDLPTKLSGKSSAPVAMVARSDTTAPGAAAEAPSQPVQLGATAKSEKAARAAPKAPQAAAERQAAPPATPRASAQQPVNPLALVFGELVGALTRSSGWAVQLAAPKSETEAKGDAARLNAKYASALNGATIGIHKAQVDGATVYRLRVVGLSKADAAALCARVKGDGGNCFIVKEKRRASEGPPSATRTHGPAEKVA